MNTTIFLCGFKPESFYSTFSVPNFFSDFSTLFSFKSIKGIINNKPILVFNLLGISSDISLSVITKLITKGKKRFGQSWNSFSRKIIILSDQQAVIDFVWNNGFIICPNIDVVEDNLSVFGDVFNKPIN